MTDDTSPPPTKQPTQQLPPRAQLPLKLRGGKTAVRGQFAALCWRRDADGAVEVCLVTGRRSGRWILPKGWPMHNQTPADAAATEAWEEAGLRGTPSDRCLGVYADVKPLSRRGTPVVVLVYPLEVHHAAVIWPEVRERKRRWFPQGHAASRLSNPTLRRIVEQFDPDMA
ncbi:NUDIX domain-containing protein [Loktanella fryxellensis]|uniref:NUDIX domain-containing protein n=1 Tax=Loktanella fryxellensis TaxID=245187 RepID=A0A1H8FXQ4_9RHOB|nr:NUDIX hydrolase [Loktanella fryxellensis]SEN36017.1 NUDIX domain-containing protein [Loktanella fryxellensis]